MLRDKCIIPWCQEKGKLAFIKGASHLLCYKHEMAIKMGEILECSGCQRWFVRHDDDNFCKSCVEDLKNSKFKNSPPLESFCKGIICK